MEKKLKQTADNKTMSIDVYDIEGLKKGSIAVHEKLSSIVPDKKLFAQYVYVYLQNQRQGTASSLDRSLVRGSTRKIYRQKGTGNARHSSRKAPIFVGGGVVGGPTPRDYSKRMNKKVVRQILLQALAYKLSEQKVKALEQTVFDMKPKTKTMYMQLKAMGIESKKILYIVPEMKKNGFILSTRNITGVELSPFSTVNAYQLLNHDEIIFVADAYQCFEKHFINA